MAAPLDHPASAPLALAELRGTVLAERYELGRVLGTGGMGAVFEARDLRLARAVAVKVMRPVFAEHAEYIRRFLREAQAASKIRHRNVVVVLDYGEAAGRLVYSVMEFLVGKDLEEVLREQPDQRLPWGQVCGLLLQIANGLKAAHGQGVIHRDIKPANCFLTQEDDEPVVKLVDFGIAKLDDAAQSQQLTSAGNLVGTPSYIAPELVRTQSPANPRSDVYSLGVVAYRMLAGSLPFTGETPFEVMRRACMEPVPRMRQHVPELPAAVESFVLEMLAKEPGDRPPDMLVVRQRLQELGRETLGAQGVALATSTTLLLAGQGRASLPATERTTLPRVVARRTVRAEAPDVEITAVQLEPLPDELDRRSPRPSGSPPAVLVAPVGAPMQLARDPASSPSRSGETLPVVGESTLRMGDSALIASPRRRRVGWLVGVGVVAAVGSLAVLAIPNEAGRSEGEIGELVAGQPAVDEAAPVEGRAVTPVVRPGEGVAEPSAAATQAHEAPVVESAAVGQPKTASKAERARRAKPSPGPPSDPELSKQLERKIKTNCAADMGGDGVTVLFEVAPNGDVKRLTAMPKNAAGECAKRQVVGTRFRPRESETSVELQVG
jgi:hypothetical protein